MALSITWSLRAKQAPAHIREAWSGACWTVEMAANGTRDGKPFCATHLFLTNLRTTPEALLQLVRDRWSIECWHWIRDTQLHEDAHRYRGKGRRGDGYIANRSAQPAQAGCLSVNPHRDADGDARHHCAAGDGHAQATAQPLLSL